MRRMFLVVVATALVVAGQTGAEAGLRVTRDPAGDTVGSSYPGQGDIRSVRVVHTRRNVVLEIRGDTGDYVAMDVDTDGRRRGAEFAVGWESYLSESVVAARSGGGRQCFGRAAGFGSDGLRFTFKRGCFVRNGRKPARLRVHTETGSFDRNGPLDAAPAGRAYGPWVRSG